MRCWRGEDLSCWEGFGVWNGKMGGGGEGRFGMFRGNVRGTCLQFFSFF